VTVRSSEMNLIFISYRREDSPDAAGRVYDRLRSYFGENQVFFDIDSIPPGVDFRGYIRDFVSKCNVLVVIIGERWLAKDSNGVSRLENPSDFVRIEIETALKRDIPVIPVPVGNAVVPSEEELPSAIKKLHYRNAYEVRTGTSFEGHIQRLIKGIENTSIRIEKPNIRKENFLARWKVVLGIVSIAIAAIVVWSLNHEGKKGVQNCEYPWQWDADLQDCIKKVTIAPKTFSIKLASSISKVEGNIYFYVNRERQKGSNSAGQAMYKENQGAIQVVIPIMRENTKVGELREVIYKTQEGAICEVLSLPETTGHLKVMKVAYALGLATDCNTPQSFCQVKLIQSGTRVNITTTALTVKIAHKCSR
jgi:hypothetical protein